MEIASTFFSDNKNELSVSLSKIPSMIYFIGTSMEKCNFFEY